jgi:hypothetical protein
MNLTESRVDHSAVLYVSELLKSLIMQIIHIVGACGLGAPVRPISSTNQFLGNSCRFCVTLIEPPEFDVVLNKCVLLASFGQGLAMFCW